MTRKKQSRELSLTLKLDRKYDSNNEPGTLYVISSLTKYDTYRNVGADIEITEVLHLSIFYSEDLDKFMVTGPDLTVTAFDTFNDASNEIIDIYIALLKLKIQDSLDIRDD